MSRVTSFVASAGVGLVVAAVAFGARGGTELTGTTYAEVALVLASGVLVVLAALRARRGALHGARAIGLFAALGVLTALSILWSSTPDLSWIEANRTFTYLAVFAAGLALARLAPGAWIVLLRGFLVGTAIVVVYGLLSRVFPAELAAREIYARLGQPFGYWNALGLAAAMGVPATLWLGSRRSGNARANALAYPLLGLLILTLFLTFSRGALAVALIGAAAWLVLVPLRLRSLTLLAVAATAAAPTIAWTSSKAAFTRDGVSPVARQTVAPHFGFLLLGTTVVLLGVGLVVCSRTWHRPAALTRSIRVPRQLRLAIVPALCILPLLVFVSVATGAHGLDRAVSSRVHQLTSDNAATAAGPHRLGQLNSARAGYWRQAGKVFANQPALGAGAGAFEITRLRYRHDPGAARHAHGYIPQTLADLGLVGLVASLALTLAWMIAASRTTALLEPLRWRRRRRASPYDAERVGAIALVLVAVVFGLHSMVDWTWFVPAPAVVALLAAGFVAGRGRLPALAAADGTQEATADGPQEEVLESGARDRTIAWAPKGLRSRRVGPGPALATALGIAMLLCAWVIAQPERSDAAGQRALALAAATKLGPARGAANDARHMNPLSPEPLLVEAAVDDAAGDDRAALKTLEDAVLAHRQDPAVWLRLADFQLHRLDRPKDALGTLRAVFYLDPLSPAGRALFLQARAGLRVLELLPGERGGVVPPTGRAGSRPGAAGAPGAPGSRAAGPPAPVARPGASPAAWPGSPPHGAAGGHPAGSSPHSPRRRPGEYSP